MGYGAVRCGAKTISNHMFYEAARTLASQVSEADLSSGAVYPDLGGIRYRSIFFESVRLQSVR